MPTRAILFDFDGVIADTENVHVAAWQRTFGVMGWLESDETCARAAEVDDRAFVAEVFARRKIEKGDVDGWVARKQELTLRLLADAPRVYPGVSALIERLKGRVRLGAVTTTWRANVEAVLRAAGLRDAFDLVIGKEDVQAPKPDPEGYRLALARLKLPGRDVVALEDSPTGLLAARGAGVRVVAVGHRRPEGSWSGDADFVAGLADLPRVLVRLGLLDEAAS
jgi:beta-phosphoglucomutase